MKTCVHCPAPVKRIGTAVTCGSAECKRKQRNARAKRNDARRRAEFAVRGESYRNQWRRPEGPRKSNTHCIDCGARVGWGSTDKTRCRACWDIVLERRPEDVTRRRRERLVRRLKQAAAGARGGGVIVDCRCWSCGTRFLVRRGEPTYLNQWCSRVCMDREKKARRRAAGKGCKITPGSRIAVYERDNWTCQLCGRGINRVVTHNHPMAATIDHIVPLGARGAHAPENWQTAHRICNSRKSDLLAGGEGRAWTDPQKI